MMVVALGPARSDLGNNLLALLWNCFSKRNSWLFSDTVAGANASAMIYSLMLTRRACNVEPYACLLHVLTELLQRSPGADITDFLPLNFAMRPTSTRTSA